MNRLDPKQYRITGGIHGVGLSVVNSLSAEMKVQTSYNGYLWSQNYQKGIPQTDVIQGEPVEGTSSFGFDLTFKPDYTIFDPNPFNYTKVRQRAQELAFLVKGLSITVRDERVNPPLEETFQYEGGLIDLVQHLNKDKKPLHEPIYGSCEAVIQAGNREPYTVGVDFALLYMNSIDSIEVSYVNTVETPDGGSHVLAMRSAIANVINDDQHEENAFSTLEVTRGLVSAISVLHPMPNFVSPTRVRLMVPAELYGAVSQAVYKTFQTAMRDHELANIIESKCLKNRKALETATRRKKK